MFLDPNLLSEDGTVALSQSKFTENGTKFAYGLSHSGSDWNTVHFKNVESGIHSMLCALFSLAIVKMRMVTPLAPCTYR